MRIQDTDKNLYDIEVKGTAKEERLKCPACHESHSKHKKNQKDMSWNNQEERGYCHRCEASFFKYKPYEEKQFRVPEWQNKTELTDKAVKYFEGRMISQKTLKKCNVYSDREWMPQFNKELEVICFPYFRDSQLVNIKYRAPGKAFKMVKGAELLFLNEDALRNYKDIIIVEGEPDYLTWVENGFDNVISVPNGAGSKDMSYFESVSDIFKDIDNAYIAVDNDTEGIKLRDELVRRIGAEKCKLLNFKDCKDSNAYFLKYHGSAFKNLISEAKEVPVKGIVHVNDIYNDIKAHLNGENEKGYSLNNEQIDEFVQWQLGRLAIVTGVPGHGKSEIVDYIVTKLNLLHGWKAAYYTPENYPLSYHYEKIYEKLIGKEFTKNMVNDLEFDQAFEYINDNYFYILDDYDMKLQQILDSAQYFVRKKGVNILVIDPFNRIEHDQNPGERDDKYINRFLNKLDRFGKLNNLLIFLVAHPRTMRKDEEVPTLYHISGGSEFFNKAEYGFTVQREKDEEGKKTNNVNIWWQKIKFKSLGRDGKSELVYNYKNGRLEIRTNAGVDNWDNSNWLAHPVEMSENLDFNIEGEEENAPF